MNVKHSISELKLSGLDNKGFSVFSRHIIIYDQDKGIFIDDWLESECDIKSVLIKADNAVKRINKILACFNSMVFSSCIRENSYFDEVEIIEKTLDFYDKKINEVSNEWLVVNLLKINYC